MFINLPIATMVNDTACTEIKYCKGIHSYLGASDGSVSNCIRKGEAVWHNIINTLFAEIFTTCFDLSFGNHQAWYYKENTVAVILYFRMVGWDLQLFQIVGNVLTSSNGILRFFLKRQEYSCVQCAMLHIWWKASIGKSCI